MWHGVADSSQKLKEWQYTKMPTLFKEVQYVFKKTTKLEDIVWAAWRHAVELKAQIRN